MTPDAAGGATPDPDAATAAGERRSPRPPPPDDGRGDLLVRLSWIGTAVYTVVAIATTVAVDTFQIALVAVCVVLFVVGFVAAFLAYAIAIGRSREDAIGMGGLFFLVGSAPTRVQRQLMASLAVEVVVAVATSVAGLAVLAEDATNVLAFGSLTPMYGLGLAGLWSARHGSFPSRHGAAGDAPAAG